MNNAELNRILGELAAKNGGTIHPQDVVDFAEPEDSPLHSRFVWDNTEAARLYRLEQARGIIRCAVIMMPNKDGKEAITRAFVSTATLSERETPYAPIKTVLTTADLRNELLEQCKRDAEAFARKYAVLDEVSAVIRMMRRKKIIKAA